MTSQPQTTEEKIRALLERARQKAGLPLPPPDAKKPPRPHSEPSDTRDEEAAP